MTTLKKTPEELMDDSVYGAPHPDLSDPRLLAELRQIIETHPEAEIHPNPPNHPEGNLVWWTIRGGFLQGRIYWDADIRHWTVRANTLLGQYTKGVPVSVHAETGDGISAAISEVISWLSPRKR